MQDERQGDPEGKRLKLRQSSYTEEASALAQCLVRALIRCGRDTSVVSQLASDLQNESFRLAEQVVGRIEPRMKSARTGHPLLENRPPNLLFLDESGSSSLLDSTDTFSLGGVAMTSEAAESYIQAADELKMKFFGRTAVVFHEPFMRKRDKEFYFAGNVMRQQQFDREFLRLLRETPFVVFGVGIRKQEFKRLFLDTGADQYLPQPVYDLAIMLMLERYVRYLAQDQVRQIGRVHLESIGAREDAEHQAALSDLLVHGTQFVSQRVFQSWVVPGCTFTTKSGSHPSEISDLVARDVFEWTRSAGTTEPKFWPFLTERFFYSNDGRFGDCGLKVFPAAEMEQKLESTRNSIKAAQQQN